MAQATTRPMFYAVRTTMGQEYNVASMLEARARTRLLPVRSILVIPRLRGVVIVEAPGYHVVARLVAGMRHVKGIVRGAMRYEDLEKFIAPRPVIEIIEVNDIVEITYGPLMGMRGRVVHVDRSKGEVKVEISEAAYPLPISINAEYVRIISKEKKEHEGAPGVAES